MNKKMANDIGLAILLGSLIIFLSLGIIGLSKQNANAASSDVAPDYYSFVLLVDGTQFKNKFFLSHHMTGIVLTNGKIYIPIDKVVYMEK